MVIIMALPLSYPIYQLLISFILQIWMNILFLYVDDEYFDNYDYDDTDDDTDDDNDHKKDSYTAAGAAPDAGAAPGSRSVGVWVVPFSFRNP